MKKILLIIIFIVVVIAGFYFFTHNSSSTTQIKTNSNSQSQSSVETTTSNSNVNTINLDAKRWQYTPETITVKKGDHVKIMITNQDTTHGISIPDFNAQGIDSVEFLADKVGTFEFHCPTFCGQGHKNMTGTLVVTE